MSLPVYRKDNKAWRRILGQQSRTLSHGVVVDARCPIRDQLAQHTQANDADLLLARSTTRDILDQTRLRTASVSPSLRIEHVYSGSVPNTRLLSHLVDMVLTIHLSQQRHAVI